jgi:hypothetical protein
MTEKVKLTVNPTEKVIAAANQEISLTNEATGQNYKLKRPGVLAQFHLVEVLGETAKNEVYMGLAFPLMYVTEINGEPVFEPRTKAEFEAIVQRLDFDGVNFIPVKVLELFGNETPEKDKAAIKK